MVRPGGQDVLVTDGPYLEGKEHVGGVVMMTVYAAALERTHNAAERTFLRRALADLRAAAD